MSPVSRRSAPAKSRRSIAATASASRGSRSARPERHHIVHSAASAWAALTGSAPRKTASASASVTLLPRGTCGWLLLAQGSATRSRRRGAPANKACDPQPKARGACKQGARPAAEGEGSLSSEVIADEYRARLREGVQPAGRRRAPRLLHTGRDLRGHVLRRTHWPRPAPDVRADV